MAFGSDKGWVIARAVCALAVVLAACSGPEKPAVDPNFFPADYKAAILKVIPDVVADPADMRDTGISDLALMQIGSSQRYAACVRFNPKKSKTEYDGIQVRLAIFNGGNLAQFIAATSEQCGNVAYKPFPELEKLCFGDRCKSKKGFF
jgi:hypothetical protein